MMEQLILAFYYIGFGALFSSLGYILGVSMQNTKQYRRIENRQMTMELMVKDLTHYARDLKQREEESTDLVMETITEHFKKQKELKPDCESNLVVAKKKRGRPRKISK